MNHTQIIAELKKKEFKPVYFFAGEEPFFIDKISDYMEDNLLEEHERDFNQTVFYGKDSNPAQIIETAKRFPMMSERQVVIVKEAQHLAQKLDEFESYFKNPQPSTVLVFCYKHKKLDKRTLIGKLITKETVFFASDKIKDYQLPGQIESQVKTNGLTISQKNSMMLSEYLGNDLGKIEMEIEKLKAIVPKGSEINSSLIEEHIGISKEYNVFELQRAIASKNHAVCYKIANHFGKNEKSNPFVLTIGFLFSYFSKVLILQFSENKNNDNALAKEAGVSPYFLKDYKIAMRNYSRSKLVKIVGYLKEYDLKSKGVNNTSASHNDLLKELLFKILN